MEQQLQRLAGNKEEILKLLPASQRKMFTRMPPEMQAQFFEQFAGMTKKVQGGTRPPETPAPTRRKTLADQDLGPLMGVEKAWHGLHYLLAGAAQDTTPGAGEAVLGGTEIGPEFGYGPARLLEPAEVATVSKALSELTPATLKKRFKPKELDKADIYPGGWVETGEGAEWLLEAFEELRKFYAAAASRGSAILLYIS